MTLPAKRHEADKTRRDINQVIEYLEDLPPGISDHGELSGLGDDDHGQYLTTGRHDTPTRHGSSVVDHGSIGGLGDDDHPQYVLASAVSGMIAMFAGACPNGWTRYTALDGRFPKGAPSGVTSPLNTGGSTTHSHGYSQVPSHSHTVPSGGSHGHTMQSAGGHGHTVPSGGAHYHVLTIKDSSGGGNRAEAGQDTGSIYTTSTNTDGSHGHTVNSNGSHAHTVDSGGAHTHTTNAAGVASPTTNSANGEPPYKEVVFCQKD